MKVDVRKFLCDILPLGYCEGLIRKQKRRNGEKLDMNEYEKQRVTWGKINVKRITPKLVECIHLIEIHPFHW